MLNSYAEQKAGKMRAVKRPSIVATFAALEGGAGLGQGMFAFSTPDGTQTLVGIQNDVLNNSPTKIVTRLAFTTQPVDWKLTTAMSPAVVVTARDSFGNTMSSYVGTVTLSLSTNPTGATLGGTTSVAAISGVATFSNLTLNRSGDNFKLSATASGLRTAVSNTFDVTTALVFTQQPSPTAINTTFTAEVTAQDTAGATDTNYNGNVTLSIYSATAAGVLSGTLTVTAVAGIATFSNLEIDLDGIYSLVAVGEQVTTAYPPTRIVSNSFSMGYAFVSGSSVSGPFTTYGYSSTIVGSSISPTTFNSEEITSITTISPLGQTQIVFTSSVLLQTFWTSMTINGTTFLSSAATFTHPGGSNSMWSYSSSVLDGVIGATTFTIN